MSPSQKKESDVRPFWGKRPVLALIGTIFIGAVGSGLWEIAIKPLLSSSGRFLLSMVSFGSDALRDSVYDSASYDPTAVPSLIMVQAYFSLTGAIALMTIALLFADLRGPDGVNKQVDASPHVNSPNVVTSKNVRRMFRVSMKRLLYKWRWYLMVAYGLMIGWSIVNYLSINQTVLVWRYFQSDLSRCAPYLSAEEEELLRSRYAAMRCKADFTLVLEDLRKHARKNNFELRSEKLW